MTTDKSINKKKKHNKGGNDKFDSENIREADEVTSVNSSDLKKMSNFEAFAALCKGYCAINILILPK